MVDNSLIDKSTGEETEFQNSDNTVSSENLEFEFIKEFGRYVSQSGESLNGFPGGKYNFFDVLNSLDNLDAGNKSEFIKLMKKFGADNERFSTNINYENINLYSVKKQFLSSIVEQSSQTQQIKNIFEKEYEIVDYSKIDVHLNDLTHGERKTLIENEDFRASFLYETVYKEGEKGRPNRKDILKILDTFNLEERYVNFSEDQKATLLQFMDKVGLSINPNHRLDIHDVEELFTMGIFTSSEKEALLKAFVPSITLEEAISIGIIDAQAVDKYKLDLIHKNIDADTWNQLMASPELKEDLDEILSDIDESEIHIPTSNIVHDSDISLLLEAKGYQSFHENMLKVSSELQSYSKIKDLGQFRKVLGSFEKVSGAEGFDKGSYIIVNYGATEEFPHGEKEFLQVESLVAGSATQINFLQKGRGKLDITSKRKHIENYDHFITGIAQGLEAGGSIESVEIVSEKNILEKVLNNDIEKVDSMSWVPTDEMEPELEKLEQELSEKKQKLVGELKLTPEYQKFFECENNDGEEDEGCNPEENRRNAQNWLQDMIGKDEELSSLQSSISVYQETNINTLLKGDGEFQGIDSIDPSGEQYGFELGTTFQVDKKDEFFTVTFLDPLKRLVQLTNPVGEVEEFSFDAFLDAYKTKRNIRRVSKSTSMEGLLQGIKVGNKDYTKKWGDGFKLNTDGEIVKEVGIGDSKKEIVYDFLVSDDGEELVKVHKVEGDKIKISTGKVKEKFKKDKKTSKDKVIGENFQLDDKKYIVTAGFLEGWIKKNKLIPRSLKEQSLEGEKQKALVKSTQIPTKDRDGKAIQGRHTGFFSKILNNYSLAEIIQGGNLFIESFEKYLKEGNEEHATKVAYKMFGSVLPPEVKNDLRSRMESAQKKRLDDYVQKLKDVDSPIATRMIKGWLLNKDCPEYKKEAGLLFMLEKYGTLYAKSGGLGDYTGTFLWYEAFGGKIGDEVFQSVKKEAEEENVNFTEEQLIYIFIKKQCKDNGFAGVKRRSRLHKEVKKLRAVGKEDEKKTGLNDSSEPRTIQGRINVAMGEFFGGTWANGVGGIEAIINKGGELHEMNIMPFVMAFSGIAYNMDEDILDGLKNLPAESKLLSLVRMLSFKSDVDLVNNTIVELSRRIGEERGDPDMHKRALAIFKTIHNTGHPAERIDKVIKFYKTSVGSGEDKTTYGELLTNAMYMSNNGDTSKNSKFNSMIYLEKDNNDTFKQFYGKMRGYTHADGNFDKNEDMIIDSFQGTGITGLHLQKASMQLINMHQGGGFRHAESGLETWNEISNEIDAITKREYLGGTTEEKEENRKRDLTYKIKEFSAGVLTTHGSREDVLISFNKKGSTLGVNLNKWGLNFHKMSIHDGLNNDRLNDPSDELGQATLSQIADNIINGVDKTDEVLDYLDNLRNPTKQVGEKTSEAASNIIEGPWGDNDISSSDYREAA